MAEATAAERIAALRARVASEREQTRAQRAVVSESSATTMATRDETLKGTEEMDVEKRLAAFREEAEARLRVAVAEATEREQAKTAAIVAAIAASTVPFAGAWRSAPTGEYFGNSPS